MKIALVTPYDYPYPGGVTEHIRHLDREFRARGHETRILAPSTEPAEMLPANVIPISRDIVPVPVNGSTARITLSPDSARRVEEILAAEQFDIVHLHEPEVPLLGWAVLHTSRTVNVGTFHAYSENHALDEYTQPLMEWVHAHLDGRIFVSPAVRETLAPYSAGEYRVIPNGIDYARFADPALKVIPDFGDGRPNILFVGRLDARKGFAHLLHAYPRIKRAVPNARLIVVGAYSSEDQARVVEQVGPLDLRDVHFIGRVAPLDLARYYHTATLFSAPSTGGESFGIVLLEAMAAGLPVVASDIAGYRSVVQDKVQGRLVTPGDEKALADRIVELLRDPAQRARLARQGRATAARYDWRMVAPRVLEYYTDLLRRRPQEQRHEAKASWGMPASSNVSGVELVVSGLLTGLSIWETERARRAEASAQAAVRMARISSLPATQSRL